MGKFILYLLTLSTTSSALFFPWIGVVAYYTLAIWAPQNIWFWVFEDLRISYYVSIATMIGFMLTFLRKKTNLSILKNVQNLLIAILWLTLNISYLFNPYGHNDSMSIAINSHFLITLMNKIFISYLIAVLLIDTKKKLHVLVIVLLLFVTYYTY